MTTTNLEVENPLLPDGTEEPEQRRRPSERVTVGLLLAGSLLLFTWGLSRNGWANDFYTAAVQAGSKSWKAFFFGSSDAGNTITVDKPPMALWPQALAVRAFGLNPWSILIPEALMGVASVGALYLAVRRWFGRWAALIAGVVLALTPAAALMFRFNNPDALLALLLLIATYAALRAIEGDQLRWYVLCGVAVGFGFLTKQLQAMLVVPGFALALLIAGRGSFWRRLRGLGIAGVALVVSAGWWVAAVELWPKGSRPYIGGSTNNSFLQLTFGYNGLGRLTGNEAGGFGGPAGSRGFGGAASIFGGSTGVGRLFAGVVGGQAAWLLPAALAVVVIGLVITVRAPRLDLRRASLIVWGMSLVVTAATFSFMGGIFHEYYTVALAPPIGGLCGIGASLLWSRRGHWATSLAGAVVVAGSTVWAVVLLDRAASWNAWLRDVVVATGVLATIGLLVVAVVALRHWSVPRLVPRVVVALSGVGLLAGPAAWSTQTALTARSGSIVTAGPTVAGGGGLGCAALREIRDELPEGFPLPSGNLPGGGGDFPGAGGGFPGGGAGPSAGGVGGGLGDAKPSAEVLAVLSSGNKHYQWMAAAQGATAAAPYQLATGQAVMPIGGFSGSDPAPTLAAFKRDVARGQVHWFIGGAGGFGGLGETGLRGPSGFELPAGVELPEGFSLPGGAVGSSTDAPTAAPGGGAETDRAPFAGGPGGGEAQEISRWVSSHFRAKTVDGVTLYDLSKPK